MGEDAKDGILNWVMNQTSLGDEAGALLARSLPLDINIDMSPVESGGIQLVSAEGRSGVADIQISMRFADGIANLMQAPTGISGTLHGDDADALFQQLGLGDTAILAQGQGVDIAFSAAGVLSNSMDTQISMGGGDETLSYSGNVDVSKFPEFEGEGNVTFSLLDFAPLQGVLELQGLHIPSANGEVALSFNGLNFVSLDNLVVQNASDGAQVEGHFTHKTEGDSKSVLGQVFVEEIDVADILTSLSGPSAGIYADGIWPVGPLDLGNGTRNSKGSALG